MPKSAAIVLAALLAVLAGRALAAALTPAEVETSLRAKGPDRTDRDLWRSGRWNAVEKGMSSGDPAWIALAPKLAPGTDGAMSEGLGISLAFALPRNPAAVLAVVDMRDRGALRVSRVCGLPFIEDTEPKGYRPAVLSALSRVEGPRLQERKETCLRTFRLALDTLGRGAALTDIRPIPLKPGVNRITQMVTGAARAGLIIEATHQDSDVADGTSIQFLVLVQDGEGWKSIDVKSSQNGAPGLEVIRAIPHAGDDWKQAVVFAHATIDRAPAFVMLTAQRDMSKVRTVYDPAPVEVSTYRLEPDSSAEQDHLVQIDRKRMAGCYVNAWLALKDAFGVPLPANYESPATATACPK